jgi:hypothetical protein
VFIIFGMQKKSPPPRELFDGECYHCKNHVSWLHFKATDWLSFFFIPVIPFGTTHLLACSICGDGLELDREEGRGLDAFDEMTAAQRQEWREYLAERMEEHQLEQMSETQRNWHREQKPGP